MTKHFLLFAASIFLVTACAATTSAQTADSTKAQEPALTASVIGQVGISYGYNRIADRPALFLNFGGGLLNLKINDFAFGAGAFPSLRVQQDDLPRPALGFGFNVSYKRWSLIVPFYLEATPTRRELIPTVGIAYKF